MIQRLLIANRGEIACRVIETAQRLGIEAVAVYSEADRNARHVRLADAAYPIGPAAAKDSYLNIDRILEAAKLSQADAIHPGYGFLAENAAFAQRVMDAGIIYVGPEPKTIEQMGSKAAAKALVIPAGVPVIPGYHGEDQSDEHLADQAKVIGFPLMIKAAAGGGGKGMRIVYEMAQFIEAIHAARREATSSFGDDRVILERYLSHPRHIEAQIFGDRHGRVIHLYERDCSSQRRHQKIIEEAPAHGLPDPLRADLLSAAVDAAKAVDYVGAGTVEFLVDLASNAFYFLEMNTRLQVEHPVTEMITGLDLVEWQLRVAVGESLPDQSEIPSPNGHAFEARIYAEDPEQGFMPAIGRIQTLHWPDHVRIDTGVDALDAIGIDYDPMIAKLITHGPSRQEALDRLNHALDHTFIDGLTTNLSFLQALSSGRAMQAAAIDTGYLDRDLHALQVDDPIHADDPWWVAALHWADHTDQRAQALQACSPWAQSDGWRLGLPAQARTITLRDRHQQRDLMLEGQRGQYRIWEDGQWHEATIEAMSAQSHQGLTTGQWRFKISGREFIAINHLHDRGVIETSIDHHRHRYTIQTHAGMDEASEALGGQVTSPMPGQVMDVQVRLGQAVKTGELLAVMEAMKMELSIKALIDGTVAAIHIETGMRVDANTVLIEIEPDPSIDGS